MHVVFLAALLLASSATAQVRQTIPLANGDSVVVQQTTDADGDPIQTTILTIPGAAGGALTTGTGTTTAGGVLPTTTRPTTPGVLPTTATGTRTTAALPTLDDTTLPTLTQTTRRPGGQNGGNGQVQGVVGPPTTTYPPMTATTYNLGGVDYTWANSFVIPEVATVQVPAGTRMDASEYLKSVGAAQSSLMATYNASSGVKSSAMSLISDGALAGWMAMLVGAITAGYGVYFM